MDDWMEQTEKLLWDRIRQIQDETDGCAGMTKAEIEKRRKQADRILFTLPDADREWMDRLLVDQHILSEDARKAFYRAGVKDGLRLFLWLMKEP